MCRTAQGSPPVSRCTPGTMSGRRGAPALSTRVSASRSGRSSSGYHQKSSELSLPRPASHCASEARSESCGRSAHWTPVAGPHSGSQRCTLARVTSGSQPRRAALSSCRASSSSSRNLRPVSVWQLSSSSRKARWLSHPFACSRRSARKARRRTRSTSRGPFSRPSSERCCQELSSTSASAGSAQGGMRPSPYQPMPRFRARHGSCPVRGVTEDSTAAAASETPGGASSASARTSASWPRKLP